MNQKRVHELIILCLVGLNIVMIVFFLTKKPNVAEKPKHRSIRSEIIDILRLNNEQIIDFHDLADSHKHQMREIEVKQARLLMPYFERLIDSSVQIDKDQLLSRLQKLERRKVELTYEHFKDIKELLKKDQMHDFEFFMKKVSKVLIDK